jgi:toxin CptA
MRSSSGSATRHVRAEPAALELAWRPSRWLSAALVLLGLLAAASLIASDLPAWTAWTCAPACVAWGIAAAMRASRAPPERIGLARGPATCDGSPAAGLRVQWRGPLAFAAWRDARGRQQCRAWWPDVLPPGRRRELRLAANGDDHATRPRSMAG